MLYQILQFFKINTNILEKIIIPCRHINALSMDWIISQRSFGTEIRGIRVDCTLGRMCLTYHSLSYG